MQNHGDAPSPLEAQLVEAFAVLAEHPELGFERAWRNRRLRVLPLRCGFFLLYEVKKRRREVWILQLVHGTRFHAP